VQEQPKEHRVFENVFFPCQSTPARETVAVEPLVATSSETSFSNGEGSLDLDTLQSLVERFNGGPYSHLAQRVGRERYEALTREIMQQKAESAGAKTIWAWREGEPTGLAIVRPATWDSARLGVNCMHLEIAMQSGEESAYRSARGLIDAIVQACRDSADCLSLRIGGEQMAILQAFEDSGFNVMDSLLTFIAKAPFQEPTPGVSGVRKFRPSDLDAVKTLAGSSFVIDRWHSDPRIPREVADDVYSAWAEESCRDVANRETFVVEHGGEVVGFMSVRVDEDAYALLGLRVGIVELIATSIKARGVGVGSSLMNASLLWFKEHEMDVVQVGTQASNTSACRFYERAGYRIAASSYALTRWLDHG
jgi:ribosomal protein S18 acetylase RimI-like enzyme